jgi:hypothetical protein
VPQPFTLPLALYIAACDQLIDHYAVKVDGGMDVKIRVFFISAQDAGE